VDININQETGGLSDLLAPALRSQLNIHHSAGRSSSTPHGNIPGAEDLEANVPPPHLNVVMHVVGSRGDVQPFVALGRTIKMKYGHRVRLATHPIFKEFVEENGLEFFSIGGDPMELMAFMVKNPGLLPGLNSLRSGDIGKRRRDMYRIFKGCWRSCIEAGDGVSSISSSTDEYDASDTRTSYLGNPAAAPFIADAIIANPPSFAHIHCAEKLGIPLHLIFT